MRFPTVKQYDEMDCGPACLQIICKYYGKKIPLQYLREQCGTDKTGSSMLGIKNGATKIGLTATGIQIDLNEIEETILPCIAYWNQSHFIVIYKIENEKIYVSDPAHGLLTYTKKDFLKLWSINNKNGYLLLIENTWEFEHKVLPKENSNSNLWKQNILTIIKDSKKSIYKSFGILICVAILQLCFPIITQQLVDKGIHKKNVSVLLILLLAQLVLFIGKTIAEIFNNYIILKFGNKINITLISSFFKKLFKLPLQYFDLKRSGDILQRINDHSRIENFITNSVLTIFLSVLSLVIYSAVLLYYNIFIFLVFVVATSIYIYWFTYFLRKRAILDYKSFSKLAQRQEKNIELIQGMIDIKLNKAASKKEKEWESLQREVFDISHASTKISQWQYSGAKIINEVKNIVITFLAAYLVINNQISLGTMLAISYIVGQLNIPITNMVNFIQEYQDANLSSKRIQDIHYKEDEGQNMEIIRNFEYLNDDINLNNFSFSFHPNEVKILKNITLQIPSKKVTAIVGKSGCGKSTLLKILLKYYGFEQNKITIGDVPFEHIGFDCWRTMVSTVMQDSYIFSDTIANNICLGYAEVNKDKLLQVLVATQLIEYVYNLPLKENTKIGPNGMQISGGEKQRILLARALYKNSTYLFLDEATSSLDAITENNIYKNIYEDNIINSKTIVIVAHRLSTIKNADHIIVMDKGSIVETGTHEKLMNNKSTYFNLVQHQFENN